MAKVTNNMARSVRSAKGGFSLVEMMCVIAVVSILASITWPAVVGLVSGNRLTNNAYQLSGLVQQARTTAMAQHAYVWMGFYSYTTREGAPAVMVATLVGNTGLASDLSTANYRLASVPVSIKSVALSSAANYTTPALPGVDVTNNTDVATQAYFFNIPVPGVASAKFTNVIAFAPDGQASLPQTSTGTLQPVQCIGVGLNAAPVSTKVHTVAVQVRGLSGQVSVFQQ